MQRSYPIPTRHDQEAFLFRLYFGGQGSALEQVVRRAYLDLSRTVHGAGEHVRAQREAAEFISAALPNVRSLGSQRAFDAWHEATCRRLCGVYARAGYQGFTVGQAQKWVNMALKYVFVFGEERLSGYGTTYPLCHVPIDNVLLNKSEFKDFSPFSVAWSRIKDYEQYLSFQVAVRKTFPGIAPLAVEFHVWQRADAA